MIKIAKEQQSLVQGNTLLHRPKYYDKKCSCDDGNFSLE